MFEKIHIIIPLLASVIVTILSFSQRIGLDIMCFRLIFTIILFYILGVIVKARLQKIFEDRLYDDLEIYDVNKENQETSNEDNTILNR